MILAGKKGVSPAVATTLLVLFALILGTVTMELGTSYIQDLGENQQQPQTRYIDNVPYTCTSIDPATKACAEWRRVS